MTDLINSVALNALLAAGLALLVWMVSFLPAVRRRPSLRHLLWAVVLLKLVTPPLFEVSILPESSPPPPQSPPPSSVILPENFGALSFSQTDHVTLERPASVPSPSRIDWRLVLTVASGLGSLVVVYLSVRQLAILRRALTQATIDDERVNNIASAVAQRMKVSAPPKVYVVQANVSPLLWVRMSGPVVVLPRRIVDRMNDEELGCIVSHEFAHLLRGDHRTNLLSLLVAALCWWNPVVWWARRELRIAQEACCDALVLSRAVAARRTYAETLFRALEFIQTERPLSPAPASGFGGKSSTRRRFEMIANPHVNHRLAWWSYPVLVAALTALPCIPVHGQSDKPQGPAASPKANASAPNDGWNGELTIEGFGSDQFDTITDGSFGFEDAGEGAAYGDAGGGDAYGYAGAYAMSSSELGSQPASRKSRYRLPDYLPAAHGNAVSLGGNRYYILTPNGSDRVWYVQFVQDASDGNGKILWDATLKLPPADKLKQGDTFVLNTSHGVVTVAEVEDDYDNDRDIGVKQIDVKTGKIKDKRTLLTHMARYRTFLDSMQQENDEPNKDKDAAGTAPSTGSIGPSSAYEMLLDQEFRRQSKNTTDNNNNDGWAILKASVKSRGDDLILELDCRGKLDQRAEAEDLLKTALDLWKRTYGDAPVSEVIWSRDGQNTRITINGKQSARRDAPATEGQNPQPPNKENSGAKVDNLEEIPITGKVEVKGVPSDDGKFIDLEIRRIPDAESAGGLGEESAIDSPAVDKPMRD